MNEKALCQISYGLFIVAAKQGDKLNGQIANTVFQITPRPITIGVCINRKNLTHACIQESKAFSVSILCKDTPMKFIGTWGFKSGRDINKFEKASYKIGATGVPIVLDHTIAYIEANLINSVDVGSHTIFIGEVVDADMVEPGEAMTYLYYHESKCGLTPEGASTYIKTQTAPEKKKVEAPSTSQPPQRLQSSNARYRCKVCGYVYDPARGDPDSGIVPGTAFEDLPDDWVCPICAVGKSEFIKEV